MTLKSTISAVIAFVGAAATFALVELAAAEQASQTYRNGLATEDSYFPIGVWLQSPSNAPEYKAIGINLFIGLYEGPTEEQLAELARREMPVIAEQNDVALKSPHAGMIRGWLQPDEPDNAQPLLSGSWGSCIPANEVAKRSAEIKAKDATRPVLINFGRGVADPNWRGRGRCTGDTAYYDVAASGADILSSDIIRSYRTRRPWPAGWITPRAASSACGPRRVMGSASGRPLKPRTSNRRKRGSPPLSCDLKYGSRSFKARMESSILRMNGPGDSARMACSARAKGLSGNSRFVQLV
ncbi:MAG: hypothetical protein ABSE69_18880 [Roseiarcus sp.]|jgi:hypothetical protein